MRTLFTFLAAVFTSLQLYASDSVEVMVEFHDEPRVVTAARDQRFAVAAEAARGETFAQLKRDARGAVITRELRNLITGAVMTVPREQLAELGKLPYVKSVRVARRIVFEPQTSAVATPNAVLMPHVPEIGADKVWAMGGRGQGVVVAVIDTGIDYTRPELGGCLGPNCRVIGGWNFARNNADPAEGSYHGTPVASIIGGNSAEYVGVAPEVKFLGYAIDSDAGILAAMERAVDPNGDGNFDDRADVMNLSVGTGGEVTDRPIGSPSDLWAMAADNATLAGVVVVAATGNLGEGHAISNPAMAKTAIAVGLADRTQAGVAGLTSRGPNPEDMTIKPDVIAPGDGAWALDRGGFSQFGGTSAATPHAAGAAALLLSLHPDWTPARVKQALMNTAEPFANDDVLSQGAGMIRVDRAAVSEVVAETPSISLGLYPLPQASWTQTRTVRVTNTGSTAATFDVTAANVAGATVTVPSTLSVPSGGHADLTVRIDLTSAATPAPLTFGVGNYIRLASAQHGTIHIPWAAVKAARATVVSDAALWTMYFYDSTGVPLPAWTLTPNRSEILFAPGEYDLFAWGEDTQAGIARLVWRPKQRLETDTTITLSTTTARKVTIEARDEFGQTPASSSTGGWLMLGNDREPFRLPRFSARTIYIDPLPAGAQAVFTQSWYDAAARKLYVIPHDAIGSGTGNVTLAGGGAELERATTRAYVLPAQRLKGVSLEVRSVPPGVVETLLSHTLQIVSVFERLSPEEEVFEFEVLIGPEKQAPFTTIVNVDVGRDGHNVIRGTMRRVGENIVAANGSSVQYAGDHFIFGRGVAWPLLSFNVQPAQSKILGNARSKGAAGEDRAFETIAYATYAPDGSLRSADGLDAPTGTPGTWRFEVVTSGTLTPALPRQSKATFTLDGARADIVPPLLTNVRLVDADGRLASRLEKQQHGAVLFSAADYAYQFGPTEYRPVRAEATSIAYRFHGATEWIPLTATQVAEDTRGDGILWRADVSSITNITGPHRFVDLRIAIVDVAGNTATYELEQAFSIGPELLPRRRAVR
jgi:subtilisin family serine protease